MNRRMYERGTRINTMAELVREMEAGRPVYLNHKLQNTGWLAGMSYHTLRLFVRAGSARQKWRGAFRARLTTHGRRVMRERAARQVNHDD